LIDASNFGLCAAPYTPIKNWQFNGWFSEPESKDLNAYDDNKHYKSCLMGKVLSLGWPVNSVFDEVKSFDGEVDDGFYYIDTLMNVLNQLNLLTQIKEFKLDDNKVVYYKKNRNRENIYVQRITKRNVE
jgi:hypothetical protein